MDHAASLGLNARVAETNVYRKITWRIMPFIVVCYLCAYLDRVNVGFAKLQMMSDLGFSDAVYGFGAGIFFIGYFLFEVPSNLALHKLGARVWIARIMITWAIISALTLLVATPLQFYVARFFLGLAEAGFSPGIMLYLTYWFPAKKRGFALGFYYIAIPLAGVIGGPVSGLILQHFDGSDVMKAWQWLFLLEAAPSLLAGIAVLFLMVDKPEQAPWLTEAEKAEVSAEIHREDGDKVVHASSRAFLRDARIWKLSGVYFMTIIGLYGISFWLPSIVKNSGIKDVVTIGWLSAIPYLVAVPTIILTGISADRTRRRRAHFAVMLAVGAVGLALAGYVGQNPVAAVVWLCVGTAGMLSALSLFWGVPCAFLAGTSAAAGIATINCIGNLAGFVSPYMVGGLNVLTGNPAIGLYAVSACMLAGAALIRIIPASLGDR
ncbi:Putative metabolite transport protein NicT [Methylobacterium mesophilicum]|uniref:MFS transporter n=1 Tax=Methylobacterium mesophilicum TaxID=39956 RepID=UPI001EE37A1A|nr:MFS transporter [Methylobacterium mesophilicum]GJE21804.1 Putative metabolite transport protein NicT [Methylobacterium mesophilicum]